MKNAKKLFFMITIFLCCLNVFSQTDINQTLHEKCSNILTYLSNTYNKNDIQTYRKQYSLSDNIQISRMIFEKLKTDLNMSIRRKKFDHLIDIIDLFFKFSYFSCWEYKIQSYIIEQIAILCNEDISFQLKEKLILFAKRKLTKLTFANYKESIMDDQGDILESYAVLLFKNFMMINILKLEYLDKLPFNKAKMIFNQEMNKISSKFGFDNIKTNITIYDNFKEYEWDIGKILKIKWKIHEKSSGNMCRALEE